MSSRREPADRSRGLVIFDGDDTLWRTQELYEDAKSQFELILRSAGIQHVNPVALLDEVDARAAKKRGFTVQRLLSSMRGTYRYLLAAEGLGIDEDVRSRIASLAHLLSGPYRIYDDARVVLRSLGATHRLVLATKGTPAVQRRKIASLRLAHFFERIYVLPRKSASDYRHIVSEAGLRASDCWAIGNSLQSDVKPALRAGLKAVWIDRPTWAFEDGGSPPTGRRVWRVANLTEARNLIARMERIPRRRRQLSA